MLLTFMLHFAFWFLFVAPVFAGDWLEKIRTNPLNPVLMGSIRFVLIISYGHLFCSHALESGAYTIAELANQAWHANVRTTLRYTNPSVQKMKEKANSL